MKRLCLSIPSQMKQSILEVISLQDVLGKGAYGVVRLGRYIVLLMLLLIVVGIREYVCC